MPTQSAPGDERNRPIFRLRGEFAETSDLAVTSFHGAGRARRHLGQVGGALIHVWERTAMKLHRSCGDASRALLLLNSLTMTAGNRARSAPMNCYRFECQTAGSSPKYTSAL